MAVFNKINVEFSSGMTLTESEIRALDALVGYGDAAFLKHFKENLGEHYIRDHETGLKSFFARVRNDVLPALHEIDLAKRDLFAAHDQREKWRETQSHEQK